MRRFNLSTSCKKEKENKERIFSSADGERQSSKFTIYVVSLNFLLFQDAILPDISRTFVINTTRYR